MRKSKSALLAASSIVLALAVTGCAMGTSRNHVAARSGKANVGVATRAQVALEQGDAASAVAFAEKAVENSPNEAGVRALLGNAYLSAGRFRSAEAAYADALALAPGINGVPLKLALAQAGQGKADEALQTLATYANMIDPADAGLAMALAGRPGQAVETLDNAARAPGADARVRQNLALAHALAGDWVRARAVAAQDVPGDQLEARMAEWAKLASAGQPGTQLAAVIGVTPAANDAGQPVRLALKDNGLRQRMAEAAPQAAPVALAEAAPVAEPAPASAPVAMAAADAPAAAPDVVEMVDSLRAEPVRPNGALPKVAELRRSAAKRFGESRVVVQLGAFSSQKNVRLGWSTVSKRHRELRQFVPASARFDSPRGTFYRLSLKGFASEGQARSLCTQLKASGSNCFVRTAAGDAPVKFASI